MKAKLSTNPKVKIEQYKNQRILMFWTLILLPIALIVMSRTDYVPFTWWSILVTVIGTYVLYGFACMRVCYKIECHYNDDPPDFPDWGKLVEDDFWWFEKKEKEEIKKPSLAVEKKVVDTVQEVDVSKVVQQMLLYQTTNTKTISKEYMDMVVKAALVEVKNAE